MPVIKPEGSQSARIALIGDYPCAESAAIGRPFMGYRASILADWWRQVGLQRSDFYLDYVYPYAHTAKGKLPMELGGYAQELLQRIRQLDNTYLLVPCGEWALTYLTNKRQLDKHRGSIYESIIGSKSIATLEPGCTYAQPRLAKRCLRDWARIATDSQFRDLRLPEREHYIRPTLDDLRHFVTLVGKEAESLALDIETPHGHWTCIGFSYDPSFSITVPLTAKYWGDDALREVWNIIAGLLCSRVPKTMQNGLFDSYYINWYGHRVTNWQWDTLALHHALEPVDSHSLAYMASVDTREPYWKDEAKDPTEMARYAKYDDAFWTYNGKDVAVTKELEETYRDRLSAWVPKSLVRSALPSINRGGNNGNQGSGSEQVQQQSERASTTGGGRLAFYQRHYRDMFQPLLGMSLSGIRLDEQRRQEQYDKLVCASADSLQRLSEIAGEPLHAKKGLSPVKVKRYMYETLGLPKQVKRGAGITADETAIRKLMRKFPAKFAEGGAEILNFRRQSKLASFMSGGLSDDDGYVRCQYRFTTDTGRLSSSSNPRSTGMNLQNVDREARDIFCPRLGHILLEVDLSQAEDRWVKTIAYSYKDDPRFKDKKIDWDQILWRARAMPWENDEHWRAAEIIFRLPQSKMDKNFHRQLGKKTRHACNYGEGPNRFAESLMLEDVWLTPVQSKKMLTSLLEGDPYIAVYQEATRGEIIANRELDNSWGRIYDFSFTRLDDSAYRQGYAFRPQSEVADLENQYGVIPLYNWLAEKKMESVLMAQVHDAVLVSCVPAEAWSIYTFLREKLTQPRMFRDTMLSIPVEVAIGLNWAEKQGWKHEPTETEFNELVAKLMRETV